MYEIHKPSHRTCLQKASTPGKKLSDGQGMYLLVHKNGSKYWRLDFRLNGKRKTLAIGVWPEISLTRARELREEARDHIQRGIDPLKHKRDQQRKRVTGEERTFFIALPGMDAAVTTTID